MDLEEVLFEARKEKKKFHIIDLDSAESSLLTMDLALKAVAENGYFKLKLIEIYHILRANLRYFS